MRDGTTTLLSNNLLVEIDAQGNQTKAVEFDRYRFKVGETQGESIILDGFAGHVRTGNGKEGDFWISYYETQSIEFGDQIAIAVTATPQATPTPPTPMVTPELPTLTPSPPLAIIVDTSGKTYEVTRLQAKYTAGGMWIGSRPTRIRDSLVIVLTFVKDRITTTEELEIPFASMRHLMFSEVSLPEGFEETFEGQAPIRIDMLDGTVTLLSSNLLVEIDAEGNQTRALKIDRYSFKAGETQGKAITFDGFSGRARTESGEEGDFWIPYGETQSIEFQEP